MWPQNGAKRLGTYLFNGFLNFFSAKVAEQKIQKIEKRAACGRSEAGFELPASKLVKIIGRRFCAKFVKNWVPSCLRPF